MRKAILGSRTGARALAVTAALGLLLSAAAEAASTQIQKKIPYHPMSGASPKVKEECALDTKIPEAFAAALPDVKLVNKLVWIIQLVWHDNANVQLAPSGGGLLAAESRLKPNDDFLVSVAR